MHSDKSPAMIDLGKVSEETRGIPYTTSFEELMGEDHKD